MDDSSGPVLKLGPQAVVKQHVCHPQGAVSLHASCCCWLSCLCCAAAVQACSVWNAIDQNSRSRLHTCSNRASASCLQQRQTGMAQY